MERAGRAVAIEALSVAKGLQRSKARPGISIFCGKGNNGGDGLVCARYLLSAGLDISIYLLCRRQRLRGNACYNMLALAERGINIREITGIKAFNRLKRCVDADIIIDAIFGTGLHGRGGRFYERIIDSINSSPAYTIAVDVPSGLDATTGIVKGTAVIADMTITMGSAKTGFYKASGPFYCGKIRAADIGFRR
jgi:ADP-dependent NAD(P)H-hydrate dehydratase / NAD(P)H-hydrate epimerase